MEVKLEVAAPLEGEEAPVLARFPNGVPPPVPAGGGGGMRFGLYGGEEARKRKHRMVVGETPVARWEGKNFGVSSHKKSMETCARASRVARTPRG